VLAGLALPNGRASDTASRFARHANYRYAERKTQAPQPPAFRAQNHVAAGAGKTVEVKSSHRISVRSPRVSKAHFICRHLYDGATPSLTVGLLTQQRQNLTRFACKHFIAEIRKRGALWVYFHHKSSGRPRNLRNRSRRVDSGRSAYHKT